MAGGVVVAFRDENMVRVVIVLVLIDSWITMFIIRVLAPVYCDKNVAIVLVMPLSALIEVTVPPLGVKTAVTPAVSAIVDPCIFMSPNALSGNTGKFMLLLAILIEFDIFRPAIVIEACVIVFASIVHPVLLSILVV